MPQQPQPPQPVSMVDEFARLSDGEQYERMHNAVSFTEIPDEQIPGDRMTRHAIRLALELRALAGHDCYAYRPAHSEQWVIWDRQEDPATDARFTPRQWAILQGYAVGQDDGQDDGQDVGEPTGEEEQPC